MWNATLLCKAQEFVSETIFGILCFTLKFWEQTALPRSPGESQNFQIALVATPKLTTHGPSQRCRMMMNDADSVADRFNGKIKYIRDFFITLFFAALGMQDQHLLTLSILSDSFHMDLSVDVGGQSKRIQQVLHDSTNINVFSVFLHVCLWLERPSIVSVMFLIGSCHSCDWTTACLVFLSSTRLEHMLRLCE